MIVVGEQRCGTSSCYNDDRASRLQIMDVFYNSENFERHNNRIGSFWMMYRYVTHYGDLAP